MSKHNLEDADIEATLPRKKSKKDKKDKVRKAKTHVNDSAVSTPIQSDVQNADGTTNEDGMILKKSKKAKKDKKDKSEKSPENGDDSESETLAEEKKAKKEKDEKKKSQKQGQDADTAANGSANGHIESTVSNGENGTALPLSVPESEVKTFLSTHQITVVDPLSDKPLQPIMKFSQLPPSPLTTKNPFAAFKAPTPIQAASWPFGLSGRDIVGVAETGSGKTIAFGLPLVNAVLDMPKTQGGGRIRAVVVSPTRELAMQTNEELSKLASHVGLKTVCVYGGASKDDQRHLLRKADIIVATPGRLKDFLEEGAVKLDNARFVVLDEADRMLDKGFEDDIKRIIGCTPKKEERQTLMFTATWPQSVQALALSFMTSPVRIQIGGNESGDLQANTRIEQRVEVVDQRAKEGRLLQLLKAHPKNERVLVFCLYKKEATRVEAFLQQRGIKVVGIHGDLKQEQRTRSLEAFKSGQTPVLVATDVAARGLDIPEVKLVINCTFPLTIEDYVHRIGRTGRAGKTGQAITLFTEHDKAHSGELVNILKAAGQPIPDELLKFGTTVKKKAHSTYGAFFKDVDMSQKGTKITFDD
ncbi:P-loop containing nucleoside triphosphate hydrolase protein [Xylaria bambusicola]|uniref:P-loop containing nucleoside triphosphate hydrolase protein n=1 Tax=Xylaria bambusicola TaxID=326684 RepID=UPI0020083767|nr:P-loop containing nucleoside triphosphate hydrolase protein [Xylaria bambusicola]KAI0506025.1 P-loop containing nucleoside triphosphate hydrolase protein [Xylaria bambusicola]